MLNAQWHICLLGYMCAGLTDPKSSFRSGWYHMWPFPGSILDLFWGNAYWESSDQNAHTGKVND